MAFSSIVCSRRTIFSHTLFLLSISTLIGRLDSAIESENRLVVISLHVHHGLGVRIYLMLLGIPIRSYVFRRLYRNMIIRVTHVSYVTSWDVHIANGLFSRSS